jgi:regulator of replication initiation timing
MSKPFEVERHDYVTLRMSTLIAELERSLDRLRALLTDSMERNSALRAELEQLRQTHEITEAKLNQVLEAMAANEIRR